MPQGQARAVAEEWGVAARRTIGGECGRFPLDTPFEEQPPLRRLLAFDQQLAEIDPAFLARMFDLPQG